MQATAKLSFRGGFTVQRARWSEPESQFGTRRFFRTPDTFGFVGADWSLPWKIEWSRTADYTGSMTASHYAGCETTRRFLVFNGVVSRLFDVGERSRMRVFANLQEYRRQLSARSRQGPLPRRRLRVRSGGNAEGGCRGDLGVLTYWIFRLRSAYFSICSVG